MEWRTLSPSLVSRELSTMHVIKVHYLIVPRTQPRARIIYHLERPREMGQKRVAAATRRIKMTGVQFVFIKITPFPLETRPAHSYNLTLGVSAIFRQSERGDA